MCEKAYVKHTPALTHTLQETHTYIHAVYMHTDVEFKHALNAQKCSFIYVYTHNGEREKLFTLRNV